MNHELKSYDELEIGALVRPDTAIQPETGSWRMEVKPVVDLDACVNCLLCWVNCPDVAVRIEEEVFAGFDYDYCKGCELCAEVCPVDAIEMVENRASVPDRGLRTDERGDSHENGR